MSLQFGNNKIGGMQYNGVTIGEAMYNGQIVYRSVPPSIYPLDGTWTATCAFGSSHTGHSHTIAEPGTYTLTHSLTGHNGAWGSVQIHTPVGNASENAWPEGVATLTVALSPGDNVVFSAQNTDWGDQTYTGSWSIVKN